MSQTKNRRAALYARFSSDIQKDQSIGDQFAVCEAVAKRENLIVAAKFDDRAKSGASMFERDGLLAMMKAAKEKQFSTVIVESLDRLSRDQEDTPHIFKRLTFYGVEIITANEGKTTELHVGIRGITSSLFLKDLASKVKRGHNGRVREGKFPGAVTYGYRRILGKPGEREIDTAQANIVRRIFREYASGVSPRAIAARLTSDGIASPSGGKIWNHQTFVGGRHGGGMIGNQLYVGQLVWGKSNSVLNPDTGKKTKRRAPDSERITKDVQHLRIVDDVLWEAAQKVRNDRAVAKFGPEGKVVRRRHISHGQHMLGGLLICGACGGHMRIAQVSRDGGPRVACANAHQHSTCEHSKSYDLHGLNAVVADGFKQHLLKPERIAMMVKELQQRFDERCKQDTTDAAAVNKVRKQLNRVEVAMSRYADAIGNSDQPIKMLSEKLTALEIERVGLAERLRMLEAEANVVKIPKRTADVLLEKLTQVHTVLKDWLDNPKLEATPEMRSVMAMVFDSFVVQPTGKRMPYEVAPNMRLGTMLGVDLTPAKRSHAQIIADEGVSCTEFGKPGNSGLTKSQYKVICLGRWKQAA